MHSLLLVSLRLLHYNKDGKFDAIYLDGNEDSLTVTGNTYRIKNGSGSKFINKKNVEMQSNNAVYSL